MNGLEDTFRELRDRFVESSLARIARMRDVAAALRADPSDADACHELMVLFHGLAGAGTSYGYPGVTRLGLIGERLTDGEPRSGPPDAVTLGVLDDLIVDLGRQLESGATAELEVPAGLRFEAAQRPHVLVVEDDAEWRRLLCQRLEQEGYDVVEADTLHGALAIVEQGLPEAIIVDVLLPDGSGEELVIRVRTLPNGAATSILVMSVRSAFVHKVEALTSGADGFFEKPVDWEGLLRRLQHLLERERQEPPRILCVEDHEEQAAYLRRLVAGAGYTVETLRNPRHFEEALAAFRPDLILMDMLMPDISGYELTRFVRQHTRFAPVPVLLMTTEGQVSARIQGLRAGCDDFLVKPVAPALLLTAIASHLERARLLKGMMEREGLTRLLTRAAFLERVKESYERARRRPELSPLVLLLDLDHFKSVNDRFGHATGDRVLVAFSTLLRRKLRHSDVVGRFGGEEFAILVDGLEEAGGLRLAERVREGLEALEHRASDETVFRVTLSTGMAWLDGRTMGLDDWLKAADDALYVAKAEGRNRVVIAANAHRPPAAAAPASTAPPSATPPASTPPATT